MAGAERASWPTRSTRYENLKIRILATEALRLLKRVYTYSVLSKMTGLSESVLSRYVVGHTVPSREQAERILSSLERSMSLARMIMDHIDQLNGLVDLSSVLGDPLVLRLIGIHFYRKFFDRGITKILVPEASGIPVATALTLTFEVPMVVARKQKTNPFEKYIEETYVDPPRNFMTFYVPEKSLRRGDRVLIVDDIVQTGITIRIMNRIVRRVGAETVGIAAIVVIGDEWRRNAGIDSLEAIVHFTKPYSWRELSNIGVDVL